MTHGMALPPYATTYKDTQMKMESCRKIIAERLKSCRRERGMSLDATAKATGVSKAMLGQIERQESTPTIATLWKIATGLNISFSSFFFNAVRPISGTDIFPDDPTMNIRVIFPFDAFTQMEMFEFTLTEHHHQRSSAHQVGVIEHIVPLEGTVEMYYDGEWRRVSPGEALRFHADQPHEYRAVTEKAVFQNILCYAYMHS